MTNKSDGIYWGSISLSGGENVRDEILHDFYGFPFALGLKYNGTVDAGCVVSLVWVSPSGREYTIFSVTGNTAGVFPVTYGDNNNFFGATGGQFRINVTLAGASATSIDYDLCTL